MKKFVIFCSMLLLGGFLHGAFAEEEITVVFFDDGYPPFYMADLEEGMVIDFLKAFDEQHDELTLVFTGVSRKRIDVMMDEGKVQASGLTNTMFVGEKAENFLFTEPIKKSDTIFFTLQKKSV